LTKIFKSLASFILGIIISGFLVSYINIFLLKDFDPKFRDAPIEALKIDLLGLIFLATIAVIVLGAVIFITSKTKKLNITKSLSFPFIIGICYPLGMQAVGKMLNSYFSAESTVTIILLWTYLILFPLITGIAIYKERITR
jgi:hypothetical protein